MESVKESRTFLRNSNFKKEVYGLKQLALLDTNSFNHAYSLVNSLPDYAETPLIQMPRLSELLDIGSLYCKYEGDRFGGSSFKSLGLSSAVIVAVERILTSTYELKVEIADLIAGKYKIETSSITFAAATSGNHGYALAWISSQLGAKCKIYCATDVSKNRIARIESMGAEVISVEGSFDRAVELCNEQSQLHGDIVISNVVQEGFEDVPKLIMNGYGIIAKEISIQLGDAFPTHIFVGGGGGRLAASIAAFYSIETKFGSPKIIVVEPDKSDCIFQSIKSGALSTSSAQGDSFMTGLVVKKPSPIAWDILENTAFASITISDAAALEVLRAVNAGTYGDQPIAIGETGIAAMAGLVLASRSSAIRSELEITKESNIVVIACEGVIDQDLLDALLAKPESEMESL
jgi:diaminopropionate ammonia-lyase